MKSTSGDGDRGDCGTCSGDFLGLASIEESSESSEEGFRLPIVTIIKLSMVESIFLRCCDTSWR